MRTTLTIDDSLAKRLKRLASKRRTSFKAVVNEALSEGLNALNVPRPAKAYRTASRQMGLRPGIDPSRLGQHADDFDDRAKVEKS